MARKDGTPPNVKRFTVQLDETMYRAIKSVSNYIIRTDTGINCKTYELINKILIVGLDNWTKDKNLLEAIKGTEANIQVTKNLKMSKFKHAKAMAALIP